MGSAPAETANYPMSCYAYSCRFIFSDLDILITLVSFTPFNKTAILLFTCYMLPLLHNLLIWTENLVLIVVFKSTICKRRYVVTYLGLPDVVNS